MLLARTNIIALYNCSVVFCIGPKLFVKPTQKSNRSIIINAVSHCCLAGHVNKDKVDKALEVCCQQSPLCLSFRYFFGADC